MVLIFNSAAYAAEPFAVVELFTSEGCSSCPPADELLIQIAKEAKKQNLLIYTLGFHVDYWNQLGWKDPFSQAEFTDRQYLYAQKSNSSSVYTPQMIINGQYGFTGSDRNKAWNTIKEELNKNTLLEIGIAMDPIQDNQYKFSYHMAHVPNDSTINIAIVEKNLSSEVTRGENSGRTLLHTNAVRYFSASPLAQTSAQSVINLSTQWKKENLAVIVYVQDNKNMQILGVSQIPKL